MTFGLSSSFLVKYTTGSVLEFLAKILVFYVTFVFTVTLVFRAKRNSKESMTASYMLANPKKSNHPDSYVLFPVVSSSFL